MRYALMATLALTVLLSNVALAQAADPDAVALQQLNGFLTDPQARHDYAKDKPDARQANGFLEKFPQYAQDELLVIVMMVMRESKEGAGKHVTAFKNGGAQGAKASFSPAVQQRIDALEARLSRDPAFNSPANLSMMKTFMPTFLGGASS